MYAKLLLAALLLPAAVTVMPQEADAGSGSVRRGGTRGRVFLTYNGRAQYFGTWYMVRNSRSSVGYSIVFNSRFGTTYRVFPSRRSVGGHVQMSYLSYKHGRANGAGQVLLRTSGYGRMYSGVIRSTHYRTSSGRWVRRTGRWFKLVFTIDG